MFIAVSNHCESCQMFFHWCFMHPHWGFWNKLLDLKVLDHKRVYVWFFFLIHWKKAEMTLFTCIGCTVFWVTVINTENYVYVWFFNSLKIQSCDKKCGKLLTWQFSNVLLWRWTRGVLFAIYIYIYILQAMWVLSGTLKMVTISAFSYLRVSFIRAFFTCFFFFFKQRPHLVRTQTVTATRRSQCMYRKIAGVTNERAAKMHRLFPHYDLNPTVFPR